MKNKLYEIEEFNNVREVLKNVVKKYPDNNAFIVKKKIQEDISYRYITYKEFQKDINSLGTALIGLGLKDKNIAVIGKNSYEWAIGYYATLNGTGIAVPLDKGLPKAEIENSLIRSKVKAVIFDKDHEEIMKEICDKKTTNIKEFICMTNSDVTEFKNLQDLLKSGEKELNSGNDIYLKAEINNETMNIMLFTSGTTAMSKVVMLSQRNITSNLYGILSGQKIYSNDVNMAFLPFHHTFAAMGLLVFLSQGATTVFCDGLRYIAQNLKEYKVTVFFCVPLILESMHKNIMQTIEKKKKTKLIKMLMKITNGLLKIGIDVRRKAFKEIINGLGGGLRFVISGAAAIDKQVAKDFNGFGILTVQGYGLTETSPVISAEVSTAIEYGSVGYPLCNVEVKIDNPDENSVGEIIIKGPNVMLGYYENEEATNATIKNGWLYTGDLGTISKSGHIFICGRQKNVIVLKNGKNIYPEEIEILIANLPYVSENIVIGTPKKDDLIISAKIVYNPEIIKEKFGEITKEEIKDKIWQDIKEINKLLPTYKYIKNIIVTDEPMIKTTTNKVKRFEEIKKINT